MGPKRFAEVEPGIYRGGTPSPDDLLVLKQVFGVVRIVSLDLNLGFEIERICKKLNLEHIIIPVLHIGDIVTEIKNLKNNINEIFSVKPMYIHCVHGRDRTGLAVALYRVSKGWTPEQALQEAKSFGFSEGLTPIQKNLYVNEIKEENKEVNDLKHRKNKWLELLQQQQDDNAAMAQSGMYQTNSNPIMHFVPFIEPYTQVAPYAYSWNY